MYYFPKTRTVRSLAMYIFTSVTLVISCKNLNLFLAPFVQVFLEFTIKTIHMRKDLSANMAWEIFICIQRSKKRKLSTLSKEELF